MFELKRNFHSVDDSMKSGKLAVSLYVDYVPFYAINSFHSKHDVVLEGENFVFPVLKNDDSFRISRYADLFQYLNGDVRLRSIAYSFKEKDTDHTAFVSHGILRDELNRVLMVLTIHKDYIIDFHRAMMENDEIDYSKFTLFISRDLVTQSKYTYLWRKIEKDYYYEAIAKNVIVEIRDPLYINKLIFQDGVNVNFGNITEFHNYLNNELYESFVQEIRNETQEEDDYDEDEDYDYEEYEEEDETPHLAEISDGEIGIEEETPLVVEGTAELSSSESTMDFNPDTNTFTFTTGRYVAGIDPISGDSDIEIRVHTSREQAEQLDEAIQATMVDDATEEE